MWSKQQHFEDIRTKKGSAYPNTCELLWLITPFLKAMGNAAVTAITARKGNEWSVHTVLSGDLISQIGGCHSLLQTFESRVRKCSYLPVIRRKRVRMTRSVKPPTAAVTMTNTWPWSDAMSDAESSGEWRMVGRRERTYRVRQRRRR